MRYFLLNAAVRPGEASTFGPSAVSGQTDFRKQRSRVRCGFDKTSVSPPDYAARRIPLPRFTNRFIRLHPYRNHILCPVTRSAVSTAEAVSDPLHLPLPQPVSSANALGSLHENDGRKLPSLRGTASKAYDHTDPQDTGTAARTHTGVNPRLCSFLRAKRKG
jgi:hypothetical protein